MYERLPKFVSASPLAPLNRAIDAVEEMRRSSTPGDYEQHFGTSAGGLVDKSLLPIRIKITGGSNPYSWAQQIQKTPTTYINTFKDPLMYFGRTDNLPAIELNGRTDVPTGTVVNAVFDRLYGKVLFEYSATEIPQDEIPVELLARSGFAFSWREQMQDENGTMVTKPDGLSGNLSCETLYEMNERTDAPLNTTVMAFPGFGWVPKITANTSQEGTGYIPEIHRYWMDNVNGGNYTLNYKGDDTAPIAWNASCTTIASTLTACTSIGNVAVTGNGNYSSPYLVQHLDDNLNHPAITANGENLTGPRLWMFSYTPPSTSNLTSVTDLTVTNVFQSDNQTTINNNFTINGNTTYVTGFNYTIYSAVNFYTAITTFNSNSTLYIYAPTTFFSSSFISIFSAISIFSSSTVLIYAPTTFYTSTTTFNSNATLNIYAPTTFYTSIMTFNSNSSLYIYAPTFWFSNTHTYNGSFTYYYFGGDTVKNYTGSNLTLNFTGLFGLTICGNTTLCANKTLTLPTIKGNNALDILQLIPKPTANTALPAMLSVENAAIQTTMISTPSMSANTGMMQLYFKSDEKLYKRNPSGTETEIGVGTGNGTSNGSLGWVQVSNGTGGFNGYSQFTFDSATDMVAMQKLTVSTLALSGNRLVYVDNGGIATNVDQIGQTFVLFGDSNNLPRGVSGFEYNESLSRIKVANLRISSLAGGGNRTLMVDNNGDVYAV